MGKSKMMRRFLAFMLAFALMFSMAPVSHAATEAVTDNVVADDVVIEGEEETTVVEETTETDTVSEEDAVVFEKAEVVSEEVEVVSEEVEVATLSEESDKSEVSEDVEATYSVSVEANEANGAVSVDITEAAEGDQVTVTAVPNDGYVLTQVAYRTVAEDGTTGKTTEVTADDNGAYVFTMPAQAVEVGAAFQPKNGAVLYNSSNSDGGVIGGSRDTDYSLYISNWDVYVNVGDDDATVYLTFDKRYMDIEGVSMNLEIRQYNDKGYKSVGRASYDYNELQALVNENATEEDGQYVMNSINIPVADGKSYEEGLYQYCVVQFACPDWVDAFGNALYRWTYTGVDVTILGAGVEAPSPIVWLYNLDENSYRGALVRQILAELKVKAGTINNENLNQNIGYLVEWDGYEPVENPYSSEEYDVEYMLMGNMSDVQLDLLLQSMNEHNIYVALKSIPTAWTASKTFAELFDIMAEESEVLQEAVALDKMIYTAESLDEETYGDSEYWDELQKTIAEALVALKTDAEETGEGADLYRNARLALEKVYLKVTNKSYLEGELELILEKQEDGNYKVSAKLNTEAENPTFIYAWKPAASSEVAAADYIIASAEDLYKVNLEITGTGAYYGTMSAKMYVPEVPEYSVTTTKDSISVELKESKEALNTPETEGYVVELYLGGELVQSQKSADVKTIVFNSLLENTEYTLKVNSYNVIGRSDIVEVTATTSEEGEVVVPDTGDDDTTVENDKNTSVDTEEEDVQVEADGEADGEAENETDGTAGTADKGSTVKTGDSNVIFVWMILLAVSALAIGSVAMIRVRHREM